MTSREGPVAVALSGGVDSSVAAALLLEQGREVLGVHLRLMDTEPSARAEADARRTAEALGIELRVLDGREAFRDEVTEPFIAAYLDGRTPNPCVLCNRAIKLGFLLEQTAQWGFETLATGHYARVSRAGTLPQPSRADADRWTLRRGISTAKDQSYYLCLLRQDQLARFETPLGDLDKEAARAMARERSLPSSARAESQDCCFIPETDYRAFITANAADRLPGEGDIVDATGKTVGRHSGAWRYTIGQRRGLGVSAPAPLYVTAIDAKRNHVIVGPKELTRSRRLIIEDVNYVSIPSIERALRCEAQIRYRHPASPARVEPMGSDAKSLQITFDTPQEAITPGQAAVLYKNNTVLAGGWIEGGRIG